MLFGLQSDALLNLEAQAGVIIWLKKTKKKKQTYFWCTDSETFTSETSSRH